MYFEEAEKKFISLKNKKDVLILAIETSCDETSVAVVKNGREVLSNVINTQIPIHKLYGGVVPEIASRNHILNISEVYKQALDEAKIKEKDIDAIAVTYGAGLVGALMVGVNFAKTLAFSLNLPLIAVSHVKGHIAANYITHKNLQPPFVCLLVSGGHTAILDIDSYNHHTLLGTTVDDAAGEAFDKVARVLGLSYPGGPEVDKLAKNGENNINFTHNIMADSLNFSFSGLKTAVINYVHNLNQKYQQISKENICASFQSEVAGQLTSKTIKACKQASRKLIVVAGGVSANSAIRESLNKDAKQNGIDVYFPELKYCTDNAAMIGAAAYFMLKDGLGLSDLSLTAKPTISL
ncbi:MAG: tRNA (adenosine(37)-N6)-threonylcarbamoyltransferase complex transferase subunit TsaD [Clostridia bacterium]|nr:tRNA (adenosine(37)-N6)-threonylcarbamoyltransferase complex transferase subunit TsaD [Clostridia bacterium]